MNNRRSNRFGLISIMLLVCFAAAIPAWAQGRRISRNAQDTQQQRDPLAFLKQALTKARASALDPSQETALNTLITNFNTANRTAAPDPAEKAARDAYVIAILAKDLGSATTAADNLADLLSARQHKMMEAEAGFQIQALGYLRSDQAAALQSSLGNDGMLRVLQSLAGFGFPFGGMRSGLGAVMLGPRPQMRLGNAR